VILETVENLSSDLRAASGYLADGNERGVVALMTSRPDQSQPPATSTRGGVVGWIRPAEDDEPSWEEVAGDR
jgi:hypothetical protein